MNLHDISFDTAFLVFKSPFRNLWPLAVVPAIAALISDHTARFVPRTPSGSIPAAALAAIPGLVGLMVIVHAINLDPVDTWRGVVAHRITPLIAVALLGYAIFRAVQRQASVSRLFTLAKPASGRLAGAAARLGLRAMEIPSDSKDCFIAGTLRPSVFVSSGALARLDEAEFDAALQHERAHVAARDTLWLMLLAFLRDLAPWGRGVAFDAFRAARETAADRVAAHAAGELSLAAAMIALAQPGRGAADSTVLPMASADNFRGRLQTLLHGESTPDLSRGERLGLMAGLSCSAALLAWPVVQFHLIELLCLVEYGNPIL
jgi:Zn-dependent protease with chaperone function